MHLSNLNIICSPNLDEEPDQQSQIFDNIIDNQICVKSNSILLFEEKNRSLICIN